MDNYRPIEIGNEDVEKKDKLWTQLEFAKKEIANFDYIGIKIATGVATVDEYAEEIEYMQSIREVIREIEEELSNLQEV